MRVGYVGYNTFLISGSLSCYPGYKYGILVRGGMSCLSERCCGQKLRGTDIHSLSKTVSYLGRDLVCGGRGVRTEGLLKLMCFRAKRIITTLDR